MEISKNGEVVLTRIQTTEPNPITLNRPTKESAMTAAIAGIKLVAADS